VHIQAKAAGDRGALSGYDWAALCGFGRAAASADGVAEWSYWDQDNDPAGVAADIYAAAQDPNGRSQYKKLLTIPTFELVQQVFALDLIGKGSKQLVVVSL